MKKLKALNLYAGIGGNRKLWEDVEVTAVEMNEDIAKVYQDFFPNDKMVVGDAHEYLRKHIDEFDFIWTSPPCPTHSNLQTMIISNTNNIVFPDMGLYQEIIILKRWFKGKFIVENVRPYYTPLIAPDAKLHRHIYWSNFNIGNFNVTDDRIHTKITGKSTVYGFNIEKYSGIEDKGKCLRNMVDPDLGNYILNCARNIITKQNIHQVDMFE